MLVKVDAATKETIAPTSKHLYTYTHAIQGFSARLTVSELESLKKHPGYVSSSRERPLKLHTTHTSQFLGLSSASGAWPATNYGEDMIIGLVDTGVWPESESFNDAGLTPIPSRWKGKCVSGTQFNSSFCNKKLIGARYYNKGLLSKNPGVKLEMNSSRDTDGHGTHTASTAVGSFVKGASYFGYANGTSSGMAPRARVAIYKAIWRYGVAESDVLAAIDQAIEDGVDILSLSLAFQMDDIFLEDDTIAIATFAAMQKGIFVAASAGNDGSSDSTVVNGAPWLLTVGAGTIDREFGATLTLGSENQIKLTTLYPGNYSLSQRSLVFLDGCASVKEMKRVRNKIIVCKDNLSTSGQVENAASAGVSGAVFITDIYVSEFYTRNSFPGAFVGLADGQKIVEYIHRSNDPKARLEFQKTNTGTKPAPMLDDYSSRGPYARCKYVIKPDLIAPGTLVLASWSSISSVAEVGKSQLFSRFNFASGTSMAAPHVAGVAALIKKAHPDWSPAAIRSALMTTANPLDNTHSPIKDIGSSHLPATPFAMGSGHVDPNKSLDPGLIYDATSKDYINLLCGMNYTAKQIKIITKSTQSCKTKSLDLNYPSFVAYFSSNLSETGRVVFEFRRTVTNVGEALSSYSAKVIMPSSGIKVTVEPMKLEFKKKNEKLSYKVSLEGPKAMEDYVVHGSLSWVHDGGKYVVRSPIVATNLVPEIIDD
ncbi:subtilisin-like protease SBT1.9 isoform X2 [Mercurialis annua]|uniref:subtilisin-like protease SBT1.9 isoform X2 n=1 Tax=Mercurialis annua TaxID=3986 RepID=UPI00215F77FE|nr:subtilisin-like protease SBT1.9 isoform X2 [Mercurialis annua]